MRPLHAAVDGWLRDGRPEAQSDDVRDHLRNCADCRHALAEIDEVRGWFEDPGEVVADDAAAAIRFRLQSEARLAGAATPPGQSGKTRTGRARWIWAAAAVTLLAGAGAFAALGTWPWSTPGEARSSLATVQALHGARVTQTRNAPDEVFELAQGTIRVSVIPLRRGERVRIRIGAETVEVRGTRFEVEADREVLGRVSVQEGHVWVHLESGDTLTLGPGQEWRRPAPPPEEEVAVADEAGGTEDQPVPVEARETPLHDALSPRAVRAHGPATGERAVVPDPEDAEGAPGQEAAPDPETGFNDAWELYRSGRTDAAAYAFDALLRQDLGPRRPDVLFWSARSHLAAGRRELAIRHLQELLRAHPGSWHAADARTLLDRLDAEPPPNRL